ncbi:polyphenol oxidase family protein [Candidatus Cyanaurora vandensis]|uniref:polyphenol oxidase family protein n=1 Tax=Candidatus Cyanaurora vandensis TaxID=2714958 RepID=UPI00257D4E7A|nr:polyphenol oxidase family protein [Candidatus Cyanaurora vandensis]
MATHPWQQQQHVLTCDLLASWPHGFFTRSVGNNPTQCARHLGLAEGYGLQQIHGAEVLTPDQLPGQGDALLSTQAGILVCVASADCVPVLVAATGVVAAVHAGWRGTAQEILPKVLYRFQQLGVDLGTVRVAIGPAISEPRYPVGEDVAQAVLQTLGQTQPTTHLDLKTINCAQALAQGVRPENIAVSPLCTYDEKDLFFSYRRDGRTGVQLSGIACPYVNI